MGEKKMTIQEFFTYHPRVALGFSGGVDSSFLLWAARSCGAEVRAYYVDTAFQPAFEKENAMRLAASLDIVPEVIELDILSCKEVTANPPDRCYYCKKRIFGAVAQRAMEDGYTVLIDGTNASDDASDRPGMRALEELQVLSPLRMCGMTKEEIRRQSEEAGLFTWNKPAYACLATRIPTGTEITPALLAKTERSEAFLRSLGFADFRIRHLGDCAKLEVRQEQLPLLLARREVIVCELKKDYTTVLLDLEVRK
jgi:uncharacterized protein